MRTTTLTTRSLTLLTLPTLLTLLTLTPLHASTITGNIQNTSGAAYATNALFAPLSTPLLSGSNIIASTPTNVVPAANASFSLTLKQGNSLFSIANLSPDPISTPIPNI